MESRRFFFVAHLDQLNISLQRLMHSMMVVDESLCSSSLFQLRDCQNHPKHPPKLSLNTDYQKITFLIGNSLLNLLAYWVGEHPYNSWHWTLINFKHQRWPSPKTSYTHRSHSGRKRTWMPMLWCIYWRWDLMEKRVKMERLLMYVLDVFFSATDWNFLNRVLSNGTPFKVPIWRFMCFSYIG